MKRGILVSLFSVALAVSSHPAQAADLKIATMRLGTSWYVFGATLYQLLKPEVPKGTRVEVIAKGGGVGNPITVSSGKAAIGLSNVVTSKWAYDGHPDIYKGKRQNKIRALAGGLNPVWFSALVREDYIKKTGNDTLEKIFKSKKPVRIVMKPRGSTVPVIADLIFDSLDTNRKAIQAKGGRILQVDPKQIPSIIRDGRADLYLDAVPLGHPTLTEVSLTGKVRFLPLPNRTIDFLALRGLTPSVIPKTYKGQSAPTPSVDLGTLIIANATMSEDLAYIVTKTICENADAMAKAHKAWNSFNPSTAWKPENTGIPLHKGAIRYYREKGWLEN
ncbi:MAG: TAXI family TRAP transporter solute-binding subunit [Verrucomicrobia bacterium]|jgi:uncharacterized protein|nr:TAXI family TRAP transporter solute-binding subunit [Verrucomicrobiota bacterium]MDA7510528.1 TAXI family TRAP transporter solute-binding subunit [Verrucomicrobiota bacterium]